MRLPSTAQHDQHDIRSSPSTGEVQRAKPRYVHGVFVDLKKDFDYERYYERLASLTCLSTSYGHSTQRDGGPSTRSRTNVGAILGTKWYQARLCDGTTVIHISILSHA